MKELDVFQQMFAIKPEQILTWLDLIDQRPVWEPQLIEKVIIMRFLLDHMEEAKALRLVKAIYRGRDTPVPVISIINSRFLDFEGLLYSLETCDLVDNPVAKSMASNIFTSFAVNVERFASTAVALQQSSSSDQLGCSSDPADDEEGEGCLQSSAGSASSDRPGP